MQQDREKYRKYPVAPYVAFIGDLSTDGCLRVNRDDIENNSPNADILEETPENSDLENTPEVFVVINSVEAKVKSNSLLEPVQ